MNLSREERELLPSAGDIEFYREHGWYISRKIIPDEIIDKALQDTERYYSGERDWSLAPDAESIDWKVEDGNVLRHNSYISLQNRQIHKLVRLPIIGAIAATLTGSPEIRLFRDTLIYKPPVEGSSQTIAGWHTDRAYWLMCSSENMISAFVPLHDCDENMGTITMLDGSHRWPVTMDLRTFHEQDLDGFLCKLDTDGNTIVKVPMVLKKGQVSFHHSRIIHGSYANLTNKPRVAMTVHMQDKENRYQLSYDSEGKLLSHANDLLCRRLASGFPDYTDPRICPVLWQQEE